MSSENWGRLLAVAMSQNKRERYVKIKKKGKYKKDKEERLKKKRAKCGPNRYARKMKNCTHSSLICCNVLSVVIIAFLGNGSLWLSGVLKR